MSAGYPLSAIVGQEALVEALLINAVAPDVGGVLVRGERIEAVGPRAQINAPSDAKVIDLPGTTLIPGMIEAHSHLHPRRVRRCHEPEES